MTLKHDIQEIVPHKKSCWTTRYPTMKNCTCGVKEQHQALLLAVEAMLKRCNGDTGENTPGLEHPLEAGWDAHRSQLLANVEKEMR